MIMTNMFFFFSFVSSFEKKGGGAFLGRPGICCNLVIGIISPPPFPLSSAALEWWSMLIVQDYTYQI